MADSESTPRLGGIPVGGGFRCVHGADVLIRVCPQCQEESREERLYVILDNLAAAIGKLAEVLGR